VSQGKGRAGGAAVGLGGRLDVGQEKEKGKGKKDAAAARATVKGPPLPFVVQNFTAGCKGRLSWSNEEIMIWLGEHAQQFLVGWKTGCYVDEALRANIINELSTQGRKLYVKALLQTCDEQGKNALQDALFSGAFRRRKESYRSYGDQDPPHLFQEHRLGCGFLTR